MCTLGNECGCGKRKQKQIESSLSTRRVAYGFQVSERKTDVYLQSRLENDVGPSYINRKQANCTFRYVPHKYTRKIMFIYVKILTIFVLSVGPTTGNRSARLQLAQFGSRTTERKHTGTSYITKRTLLVEFKVYGLPDRCQDCVWAQAIHKQ